ncbi:hypothetical protein ACIQ7J_41945, partial [Streptomyces fagopyri]
MDSHEVTRARATLALFVADVFASVPRKDQRAKGDCYLLGSVFKGFWWGIMWCMVRRHELSDLEWEALS